LVIAMDDLRRRFASLDRVPVPDVWRDVERRLETLGSTVPTRRLVAVKPERQRAPDIRWARSPSLIGSHRAFALLIAATLVAALIGGALAVRSGFVRLSSVFPPSQNPSAVVSPLPSPPPASQSPKGTASWIQTGSMKGIEPRNDLWGETATLLPNGTVLVAGGNFPGGAEGVVSTSAELYDPASGQWTQTGSMPSPHRSGHTATLLLNGKVLVAGGSAYGGPPGTGPGPQQSAALYDPATGTWTETGSMHVLRTCHTATLLPDGTVLVAGGSSGAPTRETEIYDPSTGTWTKTGSMTIGRCGHAATLLPDGKVLVVGGSNSYRGPATAEVYDPGSRTWTRSQSPVGRDCIVQAVGLADGKVLAACTDRFDGRASSASVYDPMRGLWTTAGTSITWLIGPDTLLADGRVFLGDRVAGELYDPANGTWVTAGLPTYPGSGPAGFGVSGDSQGAFWFEINTATLLLDGRVLMTNGGNAILYDPSGTP
jgi:hypothetical protein